ncbi:hypothetical protein [Streptomyces boluensis]|uniref:Uncharacterized protein n=1 Tax=Streptomyces boluensis TaxID=1775135 RepID=A0A964UQ69_9ACTN|nr:hypothetical protein [Streptomyces boluensis]NBE51988.1 hypothetical protein [Streptomyces boluensis]
MKTRRPNPAKHRPEASLSMRLGGSGRSLPVRLWHALNDKLRLDRVRKPR